MAKLEVPVELAELLISTMVETLEKRREEYRQECADIVENAILAAMEPRLFRRQRTREEAERYIKQADFLGPVPVAVMHAVTVLDREQWRERFSNQMDGLIQLRGLCNIARGTGKTTIVLQDADMGTLGQPGEAYIADILAELRQSTAPELSADLGSPFPETPAEPQPQPEMKMALNVLDLLRQANTARQEEWCPDQQPDAAFRGVELAGELGESIEAVIDTLGLGVAMAVAAGRISNVVKKLERERQGWAGSRETVEHLGEELADALICIDLLAAQYDIQLWREVVAKFNATSFKLNLKTKLPEVAP